MPTTPTELEQAAIAHPNIPTTQEIIDALSILQLEQEQEQEEEQQTRPLRRSLSMNDLDSRCSLSMNDLDSLSDRPFQENETFSAPYSNTEVSENSEFMPALSHLDEESEGSLDLGVPLLPLVPPRQTTGFWPPYGTREHPLLLKQAASRPNRPA